jgi:RNA polymerase sigma factor (sigma-70 family)
LVRHVKIHSARRNRFMAEHDPSFLLSREFEANRRRLRGVAFRMLGSVSDAEDAVQEAWIRLSTNQGERIDNLGGWLTTVVARIALDMLRSRKARREEPLEGDEVDSVLSRHADADPEQQALLAEAIGIALLVVLETLEPVDRLAFVLHDLFAMPFDEIALIIGRSTVATRQIASRARRQVQGAQHGTSAQSSEHHRVVSAFFDAAREGNFEALLALLHPDIELSVFMKKDAPHVVRGAALVARRAQLGASQSMSSHLMCVDGNVGIVEAPGGHLARVMSFQVVNHAIVAMSVIGEPERLRALRLTLLDHPVTPAVSDEYASANRSTVLTMRNRKDQ